MPSNPSKELVTFPNPNPGRDYDITFECDEFTCVCPMTGQPDFADITICYVPDNLCVELKSLKLYLWSFRDQGAFHEAVTNQILDDLVAADYEAWNAMNQAQAFAIDETIDPAETRSWIARTLESVRTTPRTGKKRPYIDAW